MAAPSLSYERHSWSTEQLQQLCLRVWEAACTKRDLNSVLAGVANALLPLVPFVSLSLVSVEEAGFRVREMHIVKAATGDQFKEPLRLRDSITARSQPRKKILYDLWDMRRRFGSGKPFTCPDLLAKDSWHDHEFRLAAAGVRAYALLPFRLGGETFGAAIFSRSEPQAFTSHELVLLRSVSGAMAAGINNALDHRRIAEVCVQLENENQELRSRIAQLSPLHAQEQNAGLTKSNNVRDQFVFLRNRMDCDDQVTLAEPDPSPSIAAHLRDEERKLIEGTLRDTAGRVSGSRGAALRLGVPASTLEFRIRRLGIDKFQFHRR